MRESPPSIWSNEQNLAQIKQGKVQIGKNLDLASNWVSLQAKLGVEEGWVSCRLPKGGSHSCNLRIWRKGCPSWKLGEQTEEWNRSRSRWNGEKGSKRPSWCGVVMIRQVTDAEKKLMEMPVPRPLLKLNEFFSSSKAHCRWIFPPTCHYFIYSSLYL